MLQLLNIFDDNETLTEYCCLLQLPIIEYLEETRPNPPVLPKDAGKRAKVTWVVGNVCLHLVLTCVHFVSPILHRVYAL